jgi:hypothetical protein
MLNIQVNRGDSEKLYVFQIFKIRIYPLINPPLYTLLAGFGPLDKDRVSLLLNMHQ